MDELSLKEQQKYEAMWEKFPEYRSESPADYLTPVFLAHFEKETKPKDTVIDFGCGAGRSAIPLLAASLEIHLVDISANCLDPELFLMHLKKRFSFTQCSLWDLPPEVHPAKWVLCLDVLEHIPEIKVEATLKAMASRMTQGGFFSIFLEDEFLGRAIGEKLHLTIRPAVWWIEKLSRYFQIDTQFPTDEKTLVLAVRCKES